MPRILKKFASPLVLIVLFCLSFQMLYAFLDRAPDTDESVYMLVARNITKTGLPFESVQDRIFFLQHPPTFCYLVALFFFLFGEGLFVGRLISTIFSVLILVLVYRIAQEFGSKRKAALVAGILAINPAFLYYSHSVYMEITQAFFNLMSVYLFLKAEKNGELKFFFLSGCFLGLSLITKYLSMILLLFFIFWFFVKYRSKFLLKKELYVLILPVGGCLLAWFVFGYALDRDQFFYQLKWWLERAGVNPYSWRAVSNFLYLKELIGVITPGFVLILLYAGYNWARTIGKRFKPDLLFLLPVYFLAYILFIFCIPMKDVRYVAPLLPVLAIFFSRHVEFSFKPNFNLKGITTALLLFALLFTLSPLSVMYDPTTGKTHPNLWRFGINRDYQYRTYKEIGMFLKTKLKRTDSFLSENKGAIIRYYADARYIHVWGLPPNEILPEITKADALVFEDNLPYISNSENAKLREQISEEYRLDKTFLRKDGKRFWIYLRKDI